MSASVKVVLYIIVILSVVCSAFFSSSEIVYSGVSKIKLQKKIEKGSKKATSALKICDNYSSTLSTILVGNNLVNILVSSMSTLLAIDALGDAKGPIFANIISTIVVLIFGEILTKTIGNRYNFGLALLFAPIFNFFKIVFFPITWFVTKLVEKLSVIWTPKEKEPTATDEELIHITEEMEEEGIIDENDAELIISAIDFCDVSAYEIMVPRVDVFAINIEDDQEEILANEEIFRYSRVPVYEDTIDNVIGILNTTALMKKILNGETIDLRQMLTEPMYVHQTKPISIILKEFKEVGQHLAIVADEFGGFMGILTIEDIVEELVGDIFDEMDEVVEDYKEIDHNVYEVDGDMNIYDFFELVNYDDRDFESKYATVGGWCTDILEKFPEEGETFTFDNLEIVILYVDKMRVEKIKVIVHQKVDEDESNDD